MRYNTKKAFFDLKKAPLYIVYMCMRNKKWEFFTGKNNAKGENMDVKELFDKYYSRLAREGMLKALFCGLIVGFAVNIVVAFTAWYYGWNG